MRRFLHLCFALGFVIVCLADAGHAADGPAYTPVLIKGHPAHPTRLLAKVKPMAQATGHASVLAANGLHATRGLDLVPGLVVLDTAPQAQAMATAGASKSDFRAAELQTRLAALRASGLFEYVEPDYLFFADAVPGDSAFADGTLWGLRNSGQNGGELGMDINAVRAWDLTTGSTDVIVAVIDTGVRYTHADLAAQMWSNPGEIAANGLDDDVNGYIDDVHGINAIDGSGSPMDDSGHGTHVAGTIGAAANNGQPHVGVAWNVRLMALKFIPAGGEGGATSDAIECINYAVAKGAKILNNSWGGGYRSLALSDAIAAAGANGALFVAAAGNDGDNTDLTPHYPSSFALENVISVAAMTRQGHLAPFSNFGSRTVHIAAPGVAIYSTSNSSDVAFAVNQGTSMATPHVSGVAALMRAYFPALSVDDARDRMFNTARRTMGLLGNIRSGGHVDAYAALTATGNGTLEVEVSPDTARELLQGEVIPFVIRVTDLVGVTGATVTARVGNGSPIPFSDNGVAPDVSANDSRYTGMIPVPTGSGLFSFGISASAPEKSSTSFDLHYVTLPRATNDSFSQRIPLLFNNDNGSGHNHGATLEGGEPTLAGQRGGASVWWTWTAHSNSSVTISTEGSNFDTLLGVFTGASVDALTEIASNDDIDGPNQPSRVTLSATAGTAYHIVVDGWEGQTGRVYVSLKTPLPPENDNFAQATPLAGTALDVRGNSFRATREPGEPRPRSSEGANSLWWSWTAPSNGTASVATRPESFFTDAAVHVGSQVSALTRVPGIAMQEGSGAPWGRVTFAAVAGATYYIAISSVISDSSGLVAFSLTLTDGPANDLFANSIQITESTATLVVNVENATTEIAEPSHGLAGLGTSVWWSWRAPSSGVVNLTHGGTYPPVLSVYLGETLSSLVRVERDAQSTFVVNAGSMYHIAVDGNHSFGSLASYVLNFSYAAAPPNDRFASRVVLTGTSVQTTGICAGASSEPGEPIHANNSPASVWWSWTAPADGAAEFETWGGKFELAIYTGASVSTLQRALNTIFAGHLVRVRVVAGMTYHIAAVAVDANAARSVFPLSLKFSAAPPNDLFAARAIITGISATVNGNNGWATREASELTHGGTAMTASVWWSWTAPHDGMATLLLAPHGFEAVMAVYTGEAISSLTSVANSMYAQPNAPIIHFPATAGSTYHFAINSKAWSGGDFSLRIFFARPPANDAFVDRIQISGGDVTVAGTNAGASHEPNEPGLEFNRGTAGSVWWTWTAPESGKVVIKTAGSAFLPRVRVFTGSNLAGLAAVAFTQQGQDGSVVFTAVAGVPYHVSLDAGDGIAGAIVLHVYLVNPPPNDNFANRLTIPGEAAIVQGSNVGAGLEVNDPQIYPFQNNASVWWSWTATSDGIMTVSTTGSDFDTVLAVFSGPFLGTLVGRGDNQDDWRGGRTSRVDFTAVAGTTYHFMVDGYRGEFGSITLRLGRWPVTTIHVPAANVPAGSSLTLTASPSGSGPFTYQWLADGVEIPGATEASYTIPSLQLFHSGFYITARVVDAVGHQSGFNVTPVTVGDPLPSNARLTNLSTRALALTGDDVLIPGFVVAGPGDKQLLIRAVGPTLAGFGVSGVLPNPRLTLKRWNGTAYDDVATNDDWGTNPNAAAIVAKSTELFAFPLTAGSADAALLVDLEPGQYSAVAGDAGTGTGIAIVELYDADPSTGSGQAPASRLINISNRGYVGVGDSIMIPGFVVSSEGPKTLLIRAVGPTLSAFGVSGVLADPTLSIYRRDQTTNTDELILTNDDWSVGPGAARTRDVAVQVQAFALPEGSKDAAFVVTLNPGIYTVHARGANNTTGVALVEVYAVP